MLFILNLWILTSKIAALPDECSIPDCPVQCKCRNTATELRVSCDQGGLNDVQLQPLLARLPQNVTHLEISGTLDRPNHFSVSRDFTQYFPNLRSLKLHHDGITSLGKRIFDELHGLETLDVSNNFIQHIDHETFENMDSIKHLYLASNRLQQIPASSFIYLKNLRTLSLAYNNFTSVPRDLLYGLSNLETLILDGNPHAFHPELFHDLRSLKALSLKACDLEHFISLYITGVPQLTSLDLSQNRLTTIPYEVAKSMPYLEELNLSGNLIDSIPPYGLQKSAIRKLILANNVLGLRPQNFSVHGFGQSAITYLDLSNNGFRWFSGSMLQETSIAHLVLSGNPIAESAILSLSSLQLIELHLADCGIRYLPNAAPMNLEHLRLLNLSSNHLTLVPESFIEQLPSLLTLDVSRNDLSTVPQALLRLINRSASHQLYLHANPWDCDCLMRPILEHMVKQISENPCELPAFAEEIRCQTPTYFNNFSLIKIPVKQLPLCSPIFGAVGLSRESEIGIIIAGSCALLLVAILIAAVICGYFMPKGERYKKHEVREEREVQNLSASSSEHSGPIAAPNAREKLLKNGKANFNDSRY